MRQKNSSVSKKLYLTLGTEADFVEVTFKAVALNLFTDQ